ncbi:MAG TPA: LamG domain-containing protein [Terracidiphilus sp.]
MTKRLRRVLVASGIAVLCLFARRGSAQHAIQAARWTFDESSGDVAHDSIGHAEGKITGTYKHVSGVEGNGLRFDGDTAAVTVTAENAPELNDSFTISSWVAINAYPWNWVPIADQSREEKAGYFFGIDSFGHLGLQLSVNGAWQFLTSSKRLPLKRWVHVAATFDPFEGMTLYIDGEETEHRRILGGFTRAADQTLLIGRVRSPLLPAQWLHPKYPVWYSFDGILDDVTLSEGAATRADVAKTVAQVHAPPGDVLPYPSLPSGPPGKGPFGAYYATLKYDDLWDAPRRVARDSDVVIRFDQSPIRFVSWQGTNYIPAWVTENGKWYSDEFVETGGLPGCPDGGDCEPMSDKHNRYSHVRILESTPARAVIHVRYGQCEVEHSICANPDPFTGWTDWADDYYTVYPDGVAARKAVAWTSNLATWHEFQESIVINQAGTRPEDNIETDALTFVNLKGETATYSWEHPPVLISKPESANIQVVNLKARWKPFQIVSPDRPLISTYMGEKSYSIFEWWNHWPVAQVRSSGISAVAPDRPSHSSLSHIEGQPYQQTANSITKIMLDGLTDKPPAELASLGRSWTSPPKVVVTSGNFQSSGYDPGQRAFVLEREGDLSPQSLSLRLEANEQAPLVNPAFVLNGWADRIPRLKLNGKPQPWGADARYGIVSTLNGGKLVVWLQFTAQSITTLEIESN